VKLLDLQCVGEQPGFRKA